MTGGNRPTPAALGSSTARDGPPGRRGDGLAAAERLLTKLRHDPAAIVDDDGRAGRDGRDLRLHLRQRDHGARRRQLPRLPDSRPVRDDRRQHLAVDGRGGQGQHPRAWLTGSGRCRSPGPPFRSGRPPRPPCTGWSASSDGPVRAGRRLADPPRRRRRGRGARVARAFQFAMTWVGMYLGLVIGKEETAAQASILIFPITMLSNVFVPTAGMPAWLRAIADWNPISAVAAAVRHLFGNPVGPGQRRVAAASTRSSPRLAWTRAAAGHLRAARHRPLRPPVADRPAADQQRAGPRSMRPAGRPQATGFDAVLGAVAKLASPERRPEVGRPVSSRPQTWAEPVIDQSVPNRAGYLAGWPSAGPRPVCRPTYAGRAGPESEGDARCRPNRPHCSPRRMG